MRKIGLGDCERVLGESVYAVFDGSTDLRRLRMGYKDTCDAAGESRPGMKPGDMRERGDLMLEALKGYAYTVIAAAIIAAVCEVLAPEGRDGKPVRLVISLFMVGAMISPLSRSAQAVINGSAQSYKTVAEEYGAKYEEMVFDNVDARVKLELISRLEERFASSGCPTGRTVSVDFDRDEFGLVTFVRVSINAAGVNKTERYHMEEALNGFFGEMCEAVFLEDPAG